MAFSGRSSCLNKRSSGHTRFLPEPYVVVRLGRHRFYAVQVLAASATTKIITKKAAVRKQDSSTTQRQQAEQQVLTALSSAKGRGKDGLSEEQLAQLNDAVAALERDGGISDPTTADSLDGQWRLLYTSRPGTASPIQRTFTGVEAFTVYQEVDLQGDEPRVNNVVDFGPRIGFLRVKAEASTDSKPLEGFTPRAGAGLPLFGKSYTYAAARPNMRIDFQFDSAAFHFKFLPFTLPYPVPFRLLRDERKGWLDVTYMSSDGTFRLSRGNKGTLFVLVKDVPVKARLMKAIEEEDDEQVKALIQLLQQDCQVDAPAKSAAASGTWRLLWSEQAEDASALQKFGTKQANSFQIIDGAAGTLENVVNISSWAKIQLKGTCTALSDTRTGVTATDAGIYLGPIKIPAPVGKPGFVDWLYLDEDLRVTRGSKGSLFVHRRE